MSVNNMVINVLGSEIRVKKDNTVKHDRYYARVNSELVTGGSIPILVRKAEKVLKKETKEVKVTPTLDTEYVDDIPF